MYSKEGKIASVKISIQTLISLKNAKKIRQAAQKRRCNFMHNDGTNLQEEKNFVQPEISAYCTTRAIQFCVICLKIEKTLFTEFIFILQIAYFEH